MAPFYQIVLDYLEAYEPEYMKALQRERKLLEQVRELASQLYAETERAFTKLRSQHPDTEDEPLRIAAEEAAIAAILPVAEKENLTTRLM